MRIRWPVHLGGAGCCQVLLPQSEKRYGFHPEVFGRSGRSASASNPHTRRSSRPCPGTGRTQDQRVSVGACAYSKCRVCWEFSCWVLLLQQTNKALLQELQRAFSEEGEVNCVKTGSCGNNDTTCNIIRECLSRSYSFK